MDRASELTDAFVELRFADYDLHRTQVSRHTLHPVWNEDFRYEVSDDADLQNEPLELRVMDYDHLSSHDAIGSVFIDLDPLVTWDDMLPDDERQIGGWFPIHDTLRGHRGDINVVARLQFFGDINPFKDSSAGVSFFSASALPPCFRIVAVHGFVESLINEDDPAFHWRDNFRTSRARQLRRLLGRETLDMGGNAIIGYRQAFDFDQDDATITARAYGTCVKLAVLEAQPILPLSNFSTNQYQDQEEADKNFTLESQFETPNAFSPTTPFSPKAAMASSVGSTHSLSFATPISPSNPMPSANSARPRHDSSSFPQPPFTMHQTNTTVLVLDDTSGQTTTPPLLTLKHIPPHTITHIGPIVSARSVKLITQDTTDETRRDWLEEVREEVRKHARSVGCGSTNHSNRFSVKKGRHGAYKKKRGREIGGCVVGYSESVLVVDNVCVVSAIGTAVRMADERWMSNFLPDHSDDEEDDEDIEEKETKSNGDDSSSGEDKKDFLEGKKKRLGRFRRFEASSMRVKSEQSAISLSSDANKRDVSGTRKPAETDTKNAEQETYAKKFRPECQACHIPYPRRRSPFPMIFTKCNLCRKKPVPEILLCTIEKPPELASIGRPYFIEARVCRPKKRKDGELNATIVSDTLPFIEYDIHRQLMYKLRVQGLNAIFGLKIQMAIGDSLIVVVATGTATFLPALPTPSPIKISRNLDVVDAEDRQILEIQRRLVEVSEANRRKLEDERVSFFQARTNLTTREKASTWGGIDTVPENGIIGQKVEYPNQVNSANQSQDLTSSDSSDSSSESEGSQDLASSPATAANNMTTNVVVQVDDDADEDLMAVLLDPEYPDALQLMNTECVPGESPFRSVLCVTYPHEQHAVTSTAPLTSDNLLNNENDIFATQWITILKEGTINAVSHHPNRQLAAIFHEIYEELQVFLWHYKRCVVVGIQYDIQIPQENDLHIRMSALVLGQPHSADEWRKHNLSIKEKYEDRETSSVRTSSTFPKELNDSTWLEEELMMFSFDHDRDDYNQSKNAAESVQSVTAGINEKSSSRITGVLQALTGQFTRRPMSAPKPGDTIDSRRSSVSQPRGPSPYGLQPSPQQSSDMLTLLISPLSYIPGYIIRRYYGRLSIHVIREQLNLNYHYGHHFTDPSAYYAQPVEPVDDGLGTFIHRFMTQVQAMARAHAIGMGGNALVGFRVDLGSFRENLKNQGYGMVSVSGDVVGVERLYLVNNDEDNLENKKIEWEPMSFDKVMEHMWIEQRGR